MSICRGVAGRRGANPIGIFIHNDAGSQNANAAFYQKWLQTHNLENGFAHYYVAQDGILQAEDDSNCAWHCGDWNGNTNYLSIEVCQSMGDLEQFKKNEKEALQLAATLCNKYGIEPSSATIRLHKEVFSTACPHRSVEIHGGTVGCKQYFINRIRALMGKSGVTIDNVKTSNVINSSANNISARADSVINFRYAVMLEDGTTLPFVTNCEDFAGIRGRKIIGVACSVDKGTIEYAGHELNGGWLPVVNGCNWNDVNNGYAGNGHILDAFKAYYHTPDWYVTRFGIYQQAQYRVAPIGGDYYSWQYDYDTESGQDGYAGCYGVPFDALQLF